jgi:hypothetical protein
MVDLTRFDKDFLNREKDSKLIHLVLEYLRKSGSFYFLIEYLVSRVEKAEKLKSD